MEQEQVRTDSARFWRITRNTLAIIGLLFLFLFSLDLMISSLRVIGSTTEEAIVAATRNPFTALFVGLLLTALIQSSSTTTAITVAIVASGFVSLEQAVFVIMGANMGTTITSTILSLTFIDKKKAFRRAVTAGTYHDFFNLLTIVLIFPFEYYYGFLSRVSVSITGLLIGQGTGGAVGSVSHFWPGLGALVDWILEITRFPVVTAILAFALVFISILLFRRLISSLLVKQSREWVGQVFFKGQVRSFLSGLTTTALIRSSTVTTSLVVPLVAQKIVRLRMGASFVRGANIGTTVTALIAASSSGGREAISLAITHLAFNIIGVVVFTFVPWIKEFPIKLATRLGRLSARRSIVLFLYIIVMFFVAPFLLIFLSGR